MPPTLAVAASDGRVRLWDLAKAQVSREIAAGAGPHPTMLLLHGLPGNERNLDLAQAARRAAKVALTVDAEESERLEMSLDIIGAIAALLGIVGSAFSITATAVQ